MNRLRYKSGGDEIKEVATHEITPGALHSALLMDMHSLEPLVGDYSRKRITDEQRTSGYVDTLASLDEEERQRTLQILDALSSIVCFDKIAFDARAIQSFRLGHILLDMISALNLEDVFVFVEFPQKLYMSAGLQVGMFRKQLEAVLKSNGNSNHYLEGTLGITPYSADDYILKDMCDGYWNRRFEVENGRSVFNMGGTGESVERLFVYLELARWLDIPATLSLQKYVAAAELAARMTDVVSRRSLDRAIDTKVSALQQIQSAIAASALQDHQLSVPPLPGYILQVAETRKLSLLDAALWVRGSPGATAFREWLWAKRRLFDPIYASDVLAKQKLEKQIKALGSRIAEEGGPQGIFIRRTEISVPVTPIPALGPLLNALGWQKLKLPTATLRRRPLYEVFMASWFGAGSLLPM